MSGISSILGKTSKFYVIDSDWLIGLEPQPITKKWGQRNRHRGHIRAYRRGMRDIGLGIVRGGIGISDE